MTGESGNKNTVMEKPLPLDGFRVVDLGRYFSAPFCAKLLADQGAEIIKIEQPGEGDPTRRIGPFFKEEPGADSSGVFLYLNTNKKSITLNLKTRTGKELFRKLAEQADLVVENFRAGIVNKLGIDYPSLEKINPRLVMVSISNFGQWGPYRDYKAAHNVLCALSGWQYICGDPNREPLQAPGLLSHYVAGLFGAIASLMGVFSARRTGSGQYVDLSMVEAMVPIQTFFPLRYSYLGEIRKRRGNNFYPGGGYIVPTRDGHVGINCLVQAHWELLCAFIGKAGMLEDPKYAQFGALDQYSKELTTLFSNLFVDQYQDEVFHSAQEWRVPIVPIFSPGDLFRSPQYKARDFLKEMDHPVMGKVKIPGVPFQMSEASSARRKRAPYLGEHNEEIYGRLGFGEEDLLKMKKGGVI